MNPDEQEWMKTNDEKLLEKLGEAPNVAFVDAYYKGFHISRTFRHFSADTVDKEAREWIEKRIQEGFVPSWNTETNKANGITGETPKQEFHKTVTNHPICGIHNVEMTWKEGVSKKTGKPYAFWGCNEKNPDGSFCTYKPQS